MTEMTVKTPWRLWAVGVVALLFNAVGPYDYVMFHTRGADYLAESGFTAEQVAHYVQMPAWMTAVWAVGVWFAIGACILLLLRNRRAWWLFAISLAAFLLSLVYHYVLTDGGALMGTTQMVISAVISAQLAALIWYSRAMAKKGVLR
jgi:uncharacterized membrane protein